MSARKYLVLLVVMITASCGDVLLKRGMSEVGAVEWSQLGHVILALANPWVLAGTLTLIIFFASYTSALSWADLTYVLPATSLYNIAVPLLAFYFLHEQITPRRWAGILLITAGVGFVATGPARTELPGETTTPEAVDKAEVKA